MRARSGQAPWPPSSPRSWLGCSTRKSLCLCCTCGIHPSIHPSIVFGSGPSLPVTAVQLVQLCYFRPIPLILSCSIFPLPLVSPSPSLSSLHLPRAISSLLRQSHSLVSYPLLPLSLSLSLSVSLSILLTSSIADPEWGCTVLLGFRGSR